MTPEAQALVEQYLDDKWVVGRFGEWPTSELAAQCRMQARDNLDTEYASFMAAVAERLASLEKLERVDGVGAAPPPARELSEGNRP